MRGVGNAAGAVLLALGTLTVLALATPSGGEPKLGVLAASCEPGRAGALRAEGVRYAVVDLAWDRYEPEPDRIDASYVADVRARIESCEDVGLDVVLGPGLQYPPTWVLDASSGTYRDQYGRVPLERVANLVFDARVRERAATHLSQVDRDLGLARFQAVRAGISRAGELGYPGPDGAGGHDSFWAFDEAAQHGIGLAADQQASPMPGWRPGDRVWDGQAVGVEQTATWFSWYRDALTTALTWQADVLRELGAQEIHLPVAGKGVLPEALAGAVRTHLSDPHVAGGALPRGLDYPAQFATLAAARRDRGPVTIVFTGLDDISAVRARALDPPLDICLPGDAELVADAVPDAEQWSAQRWTSALAHRHGLPLAGENPGDPTAPHTGGEPDSDPPREQLRHAPRYAVECGIDMYFWAFEDTLFDGRPGIGPAELAKSARRAAS